MGELLFKQRKRVWCGLPWTFTVYSFDEERIFIKSGFFTTREDEVRMYRVLDISLKRTLLQKIFGLSSIIIDSSDKTMKCFTLKNIRHAREAKEQLSQLVEAERQRKRISGREFMTHEGHESFDEDDYDDYDDHN